MKLIEPAESLKQSEQKEPTMQAKQTKQKELTMPAKIAKQPKVSKQANLTKHVTPAKGMPVGSPAEANSGLSPSIVWCDTLMTRLIGMLGSHERERLSEVHYVLMPCRSIHTFGMSVAIDVAFFDKCGRICAVYREVMPYARRDCSRAFAVVERMSQPGPWLCVGQSISEILLTK